MGDDYLNGGWLLRLVHQGVPPAGRHHYHVGTLTPQSLADNKTTSVDSEDGSPSSQGKVECVPLLVEMKRDDLAALKRQLKQADGRHEPLMAWEAETKLLNTQSLTVPDITRPLHGVGFDPAIKLWRLTDLLAAHFITPSAIQLVGLGTDRNTLRLGESTTKLRIHQIEP